MFNLDEMLAYNKAFVEGKAYEPYLTSVHPDKKVAILACMDTRLNESMMAALGMRDGDAKIIKNAGAVITDPYGATMRSLLIAIHIFDVRDILIIGHLDCGVEGLRPDMMLRKMREHGISQEVIDEVQANETDLNAWFTGFEDLDEAIRNNVRIVREHPLVPEDIKVHALKIDPANGQLYSV